MRAAPARSSMTIGEVLAALRPDFPDITISKIRFLEAEGLIEPERSTSGYRQFTSAHLQRLRFVLSAQRDRYLPLRVIKEQLAALDRGEDPPADGAGPPSTGPTGPTGPAGPGRAGGPPGGEPYPEADSFRPQSSPVRLSRVELLEAAGLDPRTLDQLEGFGLLAARGGGWYDGEALLVARTVARMRGFGLEPRHLRAFKTAADREVGLVEQVTSPLLRKRDPGARAEAEAAVRELAALSVRLHAALVRAELGPRLQA